MINLGSFMDEMIKISGAEKMPWFIKVPAYGIGGGTAAGVGGIGGGLLGAGAGYISSPENSTKEERRKRTLRGAQIGAGVGGVGGLAMGSRGVSKLVGMLEKSSAVAVPKAAYNWKIPAYLGSGGAISGSVGGGVLGAGAGYLSSNPNSTMEERGRRMRKGALIGAGIGAGVGGLGSAFVGHKGAKLLQGNANRVATIEQKLERLRNPNPNKIKFTTKAVENQVRALGKLRGELKKREGITRGGELLNEIL
jgi:hypothetical protein